MKKTSVVIGSQAMKHHFSDFPRIPSDTDVIIRKSTLEESLEIYNDYERKDNTEHGLSCIIKYPGIATPYEYLFADGQKSLELVLDELCEDSAYAPVQVLYSLKKAHIHFPIKFHKHIQDLMFLREKLRIQRDISLEEDLNSVSDLLEEFPALTQLHFEETEARVGKLKTPKMNQTAKEFFGKSKKYVKSYYDHDTMHLAMAHHTKGLTKEDAIGIPVYKSFLKDGSEVETDIDKWKDLSLTRKKWAVLEEVYVIALERKILPQIFEKEVSRYYTPIEAFDWALMRVCTTLCDGFFREFSVRAYDQIQAQYDSNYVQKFFQNISKYEE